MPRDHSPAVGRGGPRLDPLVPIVPEFFYYRSACDASEIVPSYLLCPLSSTSSQILATSKGFLRIDCLPRSDEASRDQDENGIAVTTGMINASSTPVHRRKRKREKKERKGKQRKEKGKEGNLKFGLGNGISPVLQA